MTWEGAVLRWVRSIFDTCMNSRRVHEDQRWACIVSMHNGQEEKNECTKYRRTSLLSIQGKVYGGVIIKMDEGITENPLKIQQSVFRVYKVCYSVFSLRIIAQSFQKRQKPLIFNLQSWKKRMMWCIGMTWGFETVKVIELPLGSNLKLCE